MNEIYYIERTTDGHIWFESVQKFMPPNWVPRRADKKHLQEQMEMYPNFFKNCKITT